MSNVEKINLEQQESDKQNNIFKSVIFDNNTNKLKTLIELKNINKSFKKTFSKKENVVLENVNFKIYDGEILSILGSNGCGKTTLTEIISGVSNPTSGEIISHLSNNEKIGVQFQDISFPFGLTVKDVIEFQIQISNNEIEKEELEDMIKSFNIEPLLKTRASKLSGGQQQRLNVLIALMSKPKVLFLDEFTTGLDIAIRNQIKNYILKFIKKHNITMVLISHDIDIIKDIPDRYLVIADKTIKLNATKQEVIDVFGSVDNMINYYVR